MVREALDKAAQRVPLVLHDWRFVYARNGSKYVVLQYGNGPKPRPTRDDLRYFVRLFDDDREAEGVMPLHHKVTNDYVVWKVEGQTFGPANRLAALLALGPEPFAYAVNEGREGLEGSGFSGGVARDLSFIARIHTSVGRLSEYLSSEGRDPILGWSLDGGYFLSERGGRCPHQRIGDFTIGAPDCEARAEAAWEIRGTVLPFRVHRAARNFVVGLARGTREVQAQIAIAVEEGTPRDWMATAVHVAELAVAGRATSADVLVFRDNPWGDAPPRQYKSLARVTYNPSRSSADKPWSILAADRLPTTLDIEHDVLTAQLYDPALKPQMRRGESPEQAARRIVMEKHRLPRTWEPTPGLGIHGTNRDRAQIRVTVSAEATSAIEEVRRCLTSSQGDHLFRGCLGPRT
jgi:hypothetical protein